MITAIISPYSFKGSILKLNDTINYAKEIKAKSLFLCDENFHATVAFIELCKKNKIKPIVGYRYKDKVFYAKNTNELYQLFEAYNSNNFENLNLEYIPSEEIYFAYYLPNQRYLYEIFSEFLEVKPVEKGVLKKIYCDLDVDEYKLSSNQTLPKAPENFLDLKVSNDEYERLKKEIQLVKEKDFVDYIYTIYEIVRTAENLKIKVGPGRGSAVGSLLAYKLGITKINPLKFDLMFERFLNPGRKDLPDIDLDIEDERRKELIEHLRRKFKFVYHISTFSNVGKKTLKKLAVQFKISSQKLEYLLNLPTHKSIHAAGIIISTEKINVPVKENVIEWDMNSLQKLGYIKFDILGLRTLTILSELEKKFGNVPEHDKKSYNLISKGYTTGIFQLDSFIGKRVSRLIKPDNINELSIVLSLNRPGPLNASIDKQYAEAKWKNKKILELDQLRETKGVLIYQEQIMKIAMELANFSAEESDLLRKAVAKKDKDLMEKLMNKFEKELSKKLSDNTVKEIIDVIKEFSEYAFNKSHAVAYAHITYYLSYFKTNFPKEFYKTLLKFDTSKKENVIFELQALGFNIRLPNINRINEKEKEFVIPLTLISGINEKIEIQIFQNGPYESFESFVEKNPELNFSIVESLIKVGAFDDLADSRRKLLEKLKEIRSGVNSQLLKISSKLFGKKIEYNYKPEQLWERCDMEHSILGFSITKPVKDFKNYLSPYAIAFSRNQKLATHIITKGGYATDGISTFKINAPDNTYTIINERKPKLINGLKKINYILNYIYSHKDIEKGNLYESVTFKRNGKKIKILKSRPLIDDYDIIIEEGT